MLFELAVGDAYGAGFEYVRDRGFISRYNDLSRYVKHPRHHGKPGCYTDDTQMSLAIAELVVEESNWTPEIIASKFVACFHRDPRQGYSGRFYEFLKRHKTGADFLADINPASDKSGAAMRAAPIGVYSSVEEVVAKCSMQAQVTHNTADGINAALAVSLGVHYFLYKLGARDGLPAFLVSHLKGNWAEPWIGEVGSKGWMSVMAALTSLLRNDSLSFILQSSVSWGGDVDTVASMAMALGSVSSEVIHDLPVHLVRNLEDGAYGQKYIRLLDVKLMEKYEDEKRNPKKKDS